MPTIVFLPQLCGSRRYNAEEFVEHYTAEDRKKSSVYKLYIDGQLERITLPDKDVDFLRENC